MTFEEIFNQPGTYRAEGFIKGYCYKVDENGWLSAWQYKTASDLLPTQEPPFVYKGLFKKDFKKVNLIKHLFEE